MAPPDRDEAGIVSRLVQNPDRRTRSIDPPHRRFRGRSGTSSALDGRPDAGRKEIPMIYWAAVFLVIALVAGLLGLTGVAGMSANIAWVLFIVGVVFAIVLFLTGRRRSA
jgi:uncharacterized membrane protein YtjA (UPF0391 family)